MSLIKSIKFVTLVSFLLFLFSANVFAASECPSNIISVTGNGEVKAKPDLANLSVTVQSKGKSAAEAVATNAQLVQKLINTLTSLGVAEKDIQTNNISVYPIYKPNSSENIINAYQATNSISANIRKISDVGRIIDSISSAGNYIINGVNFSIEDTSSYESDALTSAIKDARKKADTVAKAANISITGIKSININSYNFRSFVGAAPAADNGVTTPVLAGDVPVSANISVEYEIKN